MIVDIMKMQGSHVSVYVNMEWDFIQPRIYSYIFAVRIHMQYMGVSDTPAEI